MMYVDKKKIISTFVVTIANIIMLIIFAYNDQNLSLSIYLASIQLCLSLFFIGIIKNKFFSLATIFLIFSFLFHLGQGVIIAYGFDDIYFHRSILAATSHKLYMQAIYFTMISHYFITLGMIWSKPYKDIFLSSDDSEDTSLAKLRSITLILLIFSVIPLVYLDVQKIIAVQTGGYLSTYDTYADGISKYLNLIAQFARPAITALIISYKNNTKKAKIVFIISTIYLVLMMISGDRGTNMIFLLANIFVYLKIIKQVKIKTVIIYTIIFYFFLGFISTISILRDTTDISLDGLIFYYRHRASDGIVYSILREFGSTIKTLVYSIQFTTETSEYNKGLTYIVSWLVISPKLPQSLMEWIKTDFTFVRSFPLEYQESIGGSYLGEIFYNFGWVGSSLTFFIGRFVGRVNDTIERAINNKNWVLLAILMALFPNVLLWIRGYFVELIFIVFWFGLLVIVLYNSMSKNKNTL